VKPRPNLQIWITIDFLKIWKICWSSKCRNVICVQSTYKIVKPYTKTSTLQKPNSWSFQGKFRVKMNAAEVITVY